MLPVLQHFKKPLKHFGRLLYFHNLESNVVLNCGIREQCQLRYPSSFFHLFTSRLQQPATAADPSSQNEELDELYRLIEVEVRGNDKAVLKSYTQFATTAADHLGIEIGKCWTPEKAHHERFTVLKSVHVNKKNMVQYEFRTYYRFMQFHKLTGSTADTYLEYIQRNLPEGVAMKVTKIKLEKLPSHLKPSNSIENTEESKAN